MSSMDNSDHGRSALQRLQASAEAALQALHRTLSERVAWHHAIAACQAERQQMAQRTETLLGRARLSDGRLTAVIRAIQLREGNFPCFATATSGFCDQDHCAWRADCLRCSTGR